MKNLKTLFLVLLLSVFAFSCSSKTEEEVTDPQTDKVLNLLVDDGQGVIFTAKDSRGGTSQFKFYDNTLRHILDYGTIPSASSNINYTLDEAEFMLVVYNVSVNGKEFSKITCEKSNVQKLNFDSIDWSVIPETSQAENTNSLELDYCYSDTGETFLAYIFDNDTIDNERFTMYFDFVNKTFRGKIVLVNLDDIENYQSTILWFE
jgi:hypothetical protein